MGFYDLWHLRPRTPQCVGCLMVATLDNKHLNMCIQVGTDMYIGIRETVTSKAPTLRGFRPSWTARIVAAREHESASLVLCPLWQGRVHGRGFDVPTKYMHYSTSFHIVRHLKVRLAPRHPIVSVALHGPFCDGSWCRMVRRW